MPPIQNPFDSDAESSGLKKKGAKRQTKKQAVPPPLSSSSESESEAEEPVQVPKKGKKSAVKRAAPLAVNKQQSSSSESESEEDEGQAKRNRKDSILEDSQEDIAPVVAPKLKNLLWRRVASGYTSQRNFNKKGEFYIDFRISFTRDAETKDGYKKPLISFKSCASKRSAVYKAAEQLVTAAKKAYKNITPVLYSETV